MIIPHYIYVYSAPFFVLFEPKVFENNLFIFHKVRIRCAYTLCSSDPTYDITLILLLLLLYYIYREIKIYIFYWLLFLSTIKKIHFSKKKICFFLRERGGVEGEGGHCVCVSSNNILLSLSNSELQTSSSLSPLSVTAGFSYHIIST